MFARLGALAVVLASVLSLGSSQLPAASSSGQWAAPPADAALAARGGVNDDVLHDAAQFEISAIPLRDDSASPLRTTLLSNDSFAHFNYSDDSDVLRVGGATVAADEDWFADRGASVLLSDAAARASAPLIQSLALSERPTLSSIDGTADNPVIPLPPAAWSGMVGLACLGLFRARHTLKRWIF